MPGIVASRNFVRDSLFDLRICVIIEIIRDTARIVCAPRYRRSGKVADGTLG